MTMVIVLDLSREACPVPLVKARRAMDRMEPGDLLEVIIVTEDSMANVAFIAQQLGMKIERIVKDKNRKWHVLIEKEQ